MSKLKRAIELETAFETYTVDEIIGEGGAGRVYAGRDGGGSVVAIKVLANQTRDKRQRFKNETGFLSRNTHANIIRVLDCGVSNSDGLLGPFYVMPRYQSSLRKQIGKLGAGAVTGSCKTKMIDQTWPEVACPQARTVVHRTFLAF